MADGPIGFTVKEILTEIVIPDLKAIKSALDLKADRIEVLAIESRVSHLEAGADQYLKRAGPIAEEIRSHEHRVSELEKENVRRQSLVDRFYDVEKQVKINTSLLTKLPWSVKEDINKALEGYDTRIQTKAEKQFSKRDKLLLGALGLIGAAATIISTVVLLISTAGGH